MHTTKFKEMVREYKDLVYSQALYSTGNRHDAADITQNVLIKLWKNMDSIRIQTIKPWLMKVTRNCCIDLRRKKREQYFSEFSSDNDENGITQKFAAYEPDPEQNLHKAEVQRRLIDAIARLPEKIGTALILRYIHDETYEDIARTVGCPLNSVKVYLHRGRKLLAQNLMKTQQE